MNCCSRALDDICRLECRLSIKANKARHEREASENLFKSIERTVTHPHKNLKNEHEIYKKICSNHLE